jgi:hypothetical protein
MTIISPSNKSTPKLISCKLRVKDAEKFIERATT